MNETECLICQTHCNSYRGLATHLQIKHKISSFDYTIQYLYNGIKPKCLSCLNIPRYVSFEFKKYCS